MTETNETKISRYRITCVLPNGATITRFADNENRAQRIARELRKAKCEAINIEEISTT